MGTNKEPSAEQSAPQIEEDMELSPEQNSPVDQDPHQPEDGKLLNTYKWHTGAKTETAAQGAIERLEKGASNKWNKMQSWRKALSEDAGEKCSTATRGAESPSKPDKPATSRKNPFRRALSEPPGSLLSSVLNSSSGSSSAQASGTTVQDTTQRGKIRKYLQTVSQKFKRQRLQSTLVAEHGKSFILNAKCSKNIRLKLKPLRDMKVFVELLERHLLLDSVDALSKPCKGLYMQMPLNGAKE